MWEGEAEEGGRQAGRQARGGEEEEEGGSAVTCLEYQSTEETKPFSRGVITRV